MSSNKKITIKINDFSVLKTNNNNASENKQTLGKMSKDNLEYDKKNNIMIG
ncbi:1603_t:CDS:2 [Ambispora leptoticha]|uniref:1603_t:CDS:1 n=1 Tax=Ambispora leptoticha TaxID=144679 RepID=A0A9N8YTF4_9GLOM|nr:1603_t:CDS:2 [Ambispora leptoticha]